MKGRRAFVAALVGLRPPDAATKAQSPAFSITRQETTYNPRGTVQTNGTTSILSLFNISIEYTKHLESYGIDKRNLAYQEVLNNLIWDVSRKVVAMLDSDDEYEFEE